MEEALNEENIEKMVTLKMKDLREIINYKIECEIKKTKEYLKGLVLEKYRTNKCIEELLESCIYFFDYNVDVVEGKLLFRSKSKNDRKRELFRRRHNNDISNFQFICGKIFNGNVCRGLKKNIHYFEVEIRNLKTVNNFNFMGIGVLKYMELQGSYLDPIVGWRTDSIGYNSDDGTIRNEYCYPVDKSQKRGDYSRKDLKYYIMESYGKGDIIGCGIDLNKSEIFYTRNGKLLDVKIRVKLTKKSLYDLYPTISCRTNKDSLSGDVEFFVNIGTNTVKQPFAYTEFNLNPYRRLYKCKGFHDINVVCCKE